MIIVLIMSRYSIHTLKTELTENNVVYFAHEIDKCFENGQNTPVVKEYYPLAQTTIALTTCNPETPRSCSVLFELLHGKLHNSTLK